MLQNECLRKWMTELLLGATGEELEEVGKTVMRKGSFLPLSPQPPCSPFILHATLGSSFSAHTTIFNFSSIFGCGIDEIDWWSKAKWNPLRRFQCSRASTTEPANTPRLFIAQPKMLVQSSALAALSSLGKSGSLRLLES